MKFYIFVCILIVTVNASLFQIYSENFQEFKLKYSKIYRNRAEETKRFTIFQDNVHSIEEHNALYVQGLVSYKKGVNKFADQTKEEFKSLLTLSFSQRPKCNATKYIKTGLAIPDSVDWRTQGQVTGVKDQGSCGSCWAFSLTGSTEAAYYRKSGKLVSFSEQQLVDCSTNINDGCGGGYLDKSFAYLIKEGLESEVDYPYVGRDGTCQYSPSKVVTKVSDYKAITPGDEDALLDIVANIGPVSIGLDASNLSGYEKGIFEDDQCSKEFLDHAVLIVGYGSENGKDFWIVKNSWSESWGEQGYFRILRGCNECGIAQDTVIPNIV